MSVHSDEKPQEDQLAAPVSHTLSSVTVDWENNTIDLSWRTYAALASLTLLQFAQISAFTSCTLLPSYIVADLGRSDLQNWIPICLSIMQAAFSPALSHASDQLGQRKYWLILPQLPMIAGAFIASRAVSMPNLLAGQLLVGFGLATTPIAYAAPSEILPRRYRPMAQAIINFGGNCAATVTYLVSGHFASQSASGWRWPLMLIGIYTAIATILLFFTYNPVPKPRASNATLGEKLKSLDLFGNLIFFAALVILIVGISIGDNPAPWKSAKPIVLICLGGVLFIALVAYEYWKKDGILAREMFKNPNFGLALLAMFIEGIVIFAFQVFYPAEAAAVGWGSDAFRVAVLALPFALGSLIACLPFGWFSSRYRSFRPPLIFGYICYLGGIICFLCAKVGSAHWVWVGAALCGVGFSALLILLIAAAQLSVPPHFVATASALMVSIRAVGGAIATAMYGAVLNSKTHSKIPDSIAKTVLPLGLPPTSLGPFIGALAGKDFENLPKIPGVTPQIIGAAVGALKQALLDSFRYVWWVALPFTIIGIASVAVLRNLGSEMTYKVDATVETDVHVHAIKEHDEVKA